MSNQKRATFVQHAEVFADFWLGILGAGARGLAEAVGKQRAENAPNKTMEQRLENTIDRAATALRVALDVATEAAQNAEQDLTQIHSRGAQPSEAVLTSARTRMKSLVKRLSTNPPKAEAEQIVHEFAQLMREVGDGNGSASPWEQP